MTADEFGAVDIDLLADYIGDALGEPERERVALLVADDPEWRSAYSLLLPGMTTTRAELGALGATAEPMPIDVWARLDEAFSSPVASSPVASAIAEPSLIDPELAKPTEPHVEPVRGDRHLVSVPGGKAGKAAPRRRRLRWAAPIAAAAGVVAFAGFGAAYLADRPSSETSAAGSTAAEGGAAPMMDSASGAGLVSPVADDQILASGADYSSTTLASGPLGISGAPKAQKFDSPDPERASSAADAARAAPPVTALSQPGLVRLAPHDALMACLAAVAQQHDAGPIAVETVDYAKFGGAAALVVRFTAAGVRWVYATGPDCGASGRGAQVREAVRVG